MVTLSSETETRANAREEKERKEVESNTAVLSEMEQRVTHIYEHRKKIYIYERSEQRGTVCISQKSEIGILK